MTEKSILLEPYKAQEIYGKDESNVQIIRKTFPRLKIITRGELLKLIGDEEEIIRFEKFFELAMWHYERFGKIGQKDVVAMLDTKNASEYRAAKAANGEILVYGRQGFVVRARTKNQQLMVEKNEEKDLLFAIGPAGTGKTYTAVALAVRSLKNKEVRRIILTRPAVEAGENLGFLPGDMKEKLDPYLQPLYDALRDMLPQQRLESYLEDGTIEIAPLAYMRGRTLDHAFVILDEAQNATENQLKMFLTRMGSSSHFIVTGDKTQIDLPTRVGSGLLQAEKLLKNIPEIAFVYLDERDIVRHKLVGLVVKAYASVSR